VIFNELLVLNCAGPLSWCNRWHSCCWNYTMRTAYCVAWWQMLLLNTCILLDIAAR